MELSKYLNEKISDINTPILFIGSGITKRYCKINGKEPPTWKELLEIIISQYKNNKYYYNLKENEVLEKSKEETIFLTSSLKYQKIAEIIEGEFNSAVWRGELLNKEIQNKILEIFDMNPTISPMKIFISLFFENLEFTQDPILLQEIDELKKLSNKPLIIITTNYDKFLETIFKEYKIIKGQKLLTDEHFASIFKIHGCITEPKSIVLTENDYNNMKNAKKVLNARLITFFAEHPVFFLGYSLDDNNIQEFMNSIYDSFYEEEKELKKISEKFIVVNWEKNRTSTLVEDCNLLKEKIMPLKQIKTDNYLEIYKSLNNFDIKIDVTKFKFLQDLYLVALKGDKSEHLDFVFANEYKGGKLPSKTLIGAGYAVTFIAYDLKAHINKVLNPTKVNNIPISTQDFFTVFLPLIKRTSGNAPIPLFYFLQNFNDNFNVLQENIIDIIKKNCEKIRKLYNDHSQITSQKVYTNLKEIQENEVAESKRKLFILQHYVNNIILDQEIKNYIETHERNTFTRKLILLYDYKIYSSIVLKNKLNSELAIVLP